MPKIAPDAPTLGRSGLVGHAGDGAANSRGKVEGCKRNIAEKPLHERPDAIETPHVDRKMNQAAMDKDAGEQPPVLMSEHHAQAAVGSPAEELIGGRQDRINAAEHHHPVHKEAEYRQQRGHPDARSCREEVAAKDTQVAIQRPNPRGDLADLGQDVRDPACKFRVLLAQWRNDTRPRGGRGGSQERGQRLAQPGLGAEDRQEFGLTPAVISCLPSAGRLDLDLSLNQGVIHSVRPDRLGCIGRGGPPPPSASRLDQ